MPLVANIFSWVMLIWVDLLVSRAAIAFGDWHDLVEFVAAKTIRTVNSCGGANLRSGLVSKDGSLSARFRFLFPMISHQTASRMFWVNYSSVFI